MKKIFIWCIMHLFASPCSGQYHFAGRVISSTEGTPLPDVYISLKTNQVLAVTDSLGTFRFTNAEKSIAVIMSKVGLLRKELILFGNSTAVDIEMEELATELQEVTVSTGYQHLSKERATGSFTYIDNELLNRSVSTDIIGRLEGIVGSLQFDRRGINNAGNGNDYRGLRIRGIGTLNASTGPLIILDNFPFEGDINSVNPNDIEAVSILKDAAAASIWGAKAGNGVIVITTKSGKYNSPSTLSFSTNLTFQPTPDLYYSDAFLESTAFIEVEKYLYDTKFFQNSINDPNRGALTPAVELWNQYDKGIISREELDNQLAIYKNTDLRREAEKYLYRRSLNTQYSLRSTGGGKKYKYFVSGGYDKNMDNIIGNNFERYSLNFSNHFTSLKFVEVTAGLAYTRSKRQQNGIGLSDIKGKRYPYAALQDDLGNALAIPYNHSLSFAENAVNEGLLNWEYKPLEDRGLMSNTNNASEFRINLGARIDLSNALAVDLKYYSQQTVTGEKNLHLKDSYKVRDLVNRYTNSNMTRAFPYNDILNVVNSEGSSNNLRTQISYNPIFNSSKLNFISGIELREHITTTSGFELYGYNSQLLTYTNLIDYTTLYPTRPLGTARIPQPNFATGKLIDRFYSSYMNSSYDFKEKYILSGSLRWDASNLLGVKTNQRGVPLWSAGMLWKLKNEPFMKSEKVDQLDLRVTVGQSGNLNKLATALPSVRYLTDALTGLPKAVVRNPGNPQLRWEKVMTTNLALDFSLFNRRVSGTFEYYIKSSSDLLGSPLIDPTVGYKTDDSFMLFLINYAGLRAQGVDLEINTLNARGNVRWQTTLLTGFVRNRVTRYEQVGVSSVLSYTYNISQNPILNRSLDAIFSIPWNGLNPQNGDPIVNVEGKPSDNFTAYFNSLKLDDLTYSGVTIPPTFGSVRNTVSYKALSLSINLTWKAGYVFRKNSVNYYDLFSSGSGHSDFAKRWVKPGNEYSTNVPSMPAALNLHRDYVYLYSEALVESGDHIRIRDINIACDLKHKTRQMKVFLYADNLGIIWRKTKSDRDPDYPIALFPPTKSVSLGVKVDLN